ncbi:MAG: DUF4143 domain-containing protein [Spartobacteria bacterium]|nr:DUF4143 domain-containing protein [Spartobacteria bacterium]
MYLRDSSILHTLLNIRTMDELMGHPVLGASWEGFCIETILANTHRDVDAYFYRTAAGTEIDLLLVRGTERIAIEFKTSSAAKKFPMIGKISEKVSNDWKNRKKSFQ